MRIKKRHNGIADCLTEHKEQFSKVKELAARVTNIRRNKEKLSTSSPSGPVTEHFAHSKQESEPNDSQSEEIRLRL